MELQPGSIAILQVFTDKSLRGDDLIQFSKFGDVTEPRTREDRIDAISRVI